MTSNLQFINPIVFVQDINRAKAFYRDVLGLKIVSDFGAFVLFENHFSIHQARELEATIFGQSTSVSERPQGQRNLLLYFETETIQETYGRVKHQAQLIHPIVRQAWGQHVFRFYDPDGHIVEIGEPMHEEGK